MAKARQVFNHPSVEDVAGEIRTQLKVTKLDEKIKPGQRIAVTAGSRGVANIVTILRTVVEELRAVGAEPFIVPAMGSHGGSTPEGQLELLSGMGVTEESIGAPFVSSMEIEKVGELDDGVEIFISRTALEADGIFPVSRIKPHTDFKGEIESGILKMLAIGLGNQKGAEMIHWHRYDGYHRILPEAGKLIIEKTNVVLGLAVLENAYHQTASIHVLEPGAFYQSEKQLLEKAKELLPRLPFNDVDVLVVDEIGKNISGVGMDTNVTGRFWMEGESDPKAPRIKKIAVLDLTPETHGNAIGLGLADLTTKRVFEKIDHHQTYVNCLTQGSGETGKIPPYLPNDRDAIATAIRISRPVDPKDARVIRIRNTQDMETIYISEALIKEFHEKPEMAKSLQIIEEPSELQFDVLGYLTR